MLTAEKEREKARRKAELEQGIVRVVKKRYKKVEETYEDCGEDLSGLGEDGKLENYLADSDSNSSSEEIDTSDFPDFSDDEDVDKQVVNTTLRPIV